MLCRGDFLSGICSRASSLAAQSTVASPARLLDPMVSESLLMQVPIIAKTPFPVKSFFEYFSNIFAPQLSCRCFLDEHNPRRRTTIDFHDSSAEPHGRLFEENCREELLRPGTSFYFLDLKPSLAS